MNNVRFGGSVGSAYQANESEKPKNAAAPVEEPRFGGSIRQHYIGPHPMRTEKMNALVRKWSLILDRVESNEPIVLNILESKETPLTPENAPVVEKAKPFSGKNKKRR